MTIERIIVFALSLAFLCNSFGQTSGEVEPVHELFKQFPKVRDFTRSKSQKEIYFTVQSPLEEVSVITLSKIVDDTLQPPVIPEFSGKYKDLEPFISPDQKRLYFASNRPVHKDSTTTKDFDIWYVERIVPEVKWSEPINLGAPINTEYDEFYPALANNGNLYFTRSSPETKGEDDIFFSQWANPLYLSPISLNEAINSEGYEFNAYIAPDESFMIFSAYNRKDGFGSGDLYISHCNSKGQWSKAQNLGPTINSEFMDYCPFVDMNTGTLYFTSRRSTVDEKIYENTDGLLKEINKYENGLSRIYKISITDKIGN